MSRRFYCRVCKSVKRVRTLPLDLDNADAVEPTDRVGVCDVHNSTLSRKAHRRHRMNLRGITGRARPRFDKKEAATVVPRTTKSFKPSKSRKSRGSDEAVA